MASDDINTLGSFEDFIGRDTEENDYVLVDSDEDEHNKVEDQFDDYEQSIARASFGDMVNDYERNQLFYKAIQKSVRWLREKNSTSSVHALDIGCGTGLLSMMAIKSGADEVLACETFKPMADCAKTIIDRNGMKDKIKIISQQSNNVSINSNERKPNLLVAELLDTELIGEGCLFTYRDAVKRLTSEDALYVPSKARIYIQLVQSEKLFRYHQYKKNFTLGGENHCINIPKSTSNCFGSHILHDIQMNRLRPGKDFEILSEPLVAFEFEFNNLNSLKLNECKRLRIPLLKNFSEPILIFSWWDIDMDHEGEIVLTCAPYWARGLAGEDDVAWRDHWMQTIYYLPAFAFMDGDLEGFNHKEINASKSLLIDAFHDPFCFWYDLPADQQGSSPLDVSSDCWSCHCGLHSHLSRSRLLAINDNNLYSMFSDAFQHLRDTMFSNEQSLNFIYIGDESILPLLFATHSCIGKIYILTEDTKCQIYFKNFLEENAHIASKIIFISTKDLTMLSTDQTFQFSGILSELYFRNFGNLFPSLKYFHVLRKNYETLLKHSQSSTLVSLPYKIVFKCLLVEFKELWKSFADVGSNVEGFDLSQYDELIQNARKSVDWTIEPQQVWEYSCRPLLQEAIDLFEFPLNKPEVQQHNTTTLIDVSHLAERFNISRWSEKVAIVVWMEQHLDQDSRFVLSSGPQTPQPWSESTELDWCRSSYQGAGFLGKNWPQTAKENGMKLSIAFSLSLEEKQMTFRIVNN